MAPTSGSIEISTREIFRTDPAKAKAPSSIKTALSTRVIFSTINVTGRANRNTRKGFKNGEGLLRRG